MLTREDIKGVSLRTVAILRDAGYACCLFGSAACVAWGMRDRIPHDVDIVVLTDDDREEIKRKIVAVDSNFYLTRSKNPANTFRILWYRVRLKVSCKVDILLPGLLNIPPIPPDLVEVRDDLPVMPFLPLLLLKVQGWVDHMKDNRSHMKKKIPEDFRDIDGLLGMVNDTHCLTANGWLPATFIDIECEHVKTFVAEREYTKEKWKAIGFDV
ncbi:hypothetical protein APHAL10511_003313 [Amanita phalloides]|nr:hypothetical protein APHAL10511_003313 [Amanita phalloides]